jgi:hypothetical protein
MSGTYGVEVHANASPPDGGSARDGGTKGSPAPSSLEVEQSEDFFVSKAPRDHLSVPPKIQRGRLALKLLLQSESRMRAAQRAVRGKRL